MKQKYGFSSNAIVNVLSINAAKCADNDKEYKSFSPHNIKTYWLWIDALQKS